MNNELLPYQRYSALRHGHSIGNGTPTYQSWLCMKARCKYVIRDTKNKYVNRGISYSRNWECFDNFLNDMGERPDGTTLDRIDNSLGYSKENCKWSTATEQARNRRNKRLNYDDALDIAKRMLHGESAKVIAQEYGISESLPREIHKGRTWKDAYNAARD